MLKKYSYSSSISKSRGFTFLEVSIVMIILASLTIAVTHIAYTNYDNGLARAAVRKARLIADELELCRSTAVSELKSPYSECAALLNASDLNQFDRPFEPELDITNSPPKYAYVETGIPIANFDPYGAELMSSSAGVTTIRVYGSNSSLGNSFFVSGVTAEKEIWE